MKITLQYKDLIYWAIIGILLWWIFSGTKTETDTTEIDRVRFERDSIVSAVIEKEKLAGENYHRLADSCRSRVEVYERADSINIYNNRHEKGKIKKLPRSDRDRVRDSVYRANGVRISTR